MKSRYLRWNRLLPVGVLCLLAAGTATAQDNAPLAENGVAPQTLPTIGEVYPMNPDVFHNYYPNTYSGATSAELYPAPMPTPPLVGHTYYTYQPLMPHEYLYPHKRVYYTPYAGPDAFYPGGNPCRPRCPSGYGLNKTTVTWYSGGFHFNPVPLRIFPMENLRRIGYSMCNRCGRLGCGGCR